MAQSQPRAGKALRRTGVVLLIVGVVSGYVIRLLGQNPATSELLPFTFLPILMILAGAFFFWRGRQYAARATAHVPSAGSGPYVLYLRDFRTDPSTARQVFSALQTPNLLGGLVTEEEQLAEALKPFGELVAIGRPGESLPTPGAVRMYASEEEWRPVVTNQMRDARLVVIRAGSGEGLMWELKRAAELVSPQKLLLLVLAMKKDQYKYFRQAAHAVFGVALPDAERFARFGRIFGFISFSADWNAAFLPLTAPFLSRSAYKPFRRTFKFALKPVFQAFGVEWQQPPVSRLMVSLIGMLGLFGILILLGLTMAFTRMSRAVAAPDVVEAVPVKSEDAYAAAFDRAVSRMRESAELRQATETAGWDEADAPAIGKRLAAGGLQRLDDEMLIR